VPTTRAKSPHAARPAITDVDAQFREDFLRAVLHFGLGRDDAEALVQACCGRPFGACGPVELLPILDDLLALARRAARPGRDT